jgi:hypothetical protein
MVIGYESSEAAVFDVLGAMVGAIVVFPPVGVNPWAVNVVNLPLMAM